MPPKTSQAVVKAVPKTPQKPKAAAASKSGESSHTVGKATPKTPQKPKAAAVPESGEKPVHTTARKPAPRRKDPVKYMDLPEDNSGAPIPIAVSFEGDSAESQLSPKTGTYDHNIKLQAPRSFSLVKTMVLTEGDLVSYQAIIIRPAKAFPFLSLSEEVRNRIYRFYFAPGGVVGDEIKIDGKHRAGTSMVAKAYAKGDKNRVALLAANKEIYAEAIKVFYGHTIGFESTTTLLDWLGQVQPRAREKLTSVNVKTYARTSSRNALHFLAEAYNLQHLHIDTGIATDADAAKAAKSFFADAFKFLESMATKKASRDAAVDMLSFGKGNKCFAIKEGKNEARKWTKDELDEFKEMLKEKLLVPKSSGLSLNK